MSFTTPTFRRLLPLAGLCLVMAALVGAASFASASGESEARELQGEYFWTGGNAQGELRAVFRPARGEDRWNVDFHFRFRGKPHVYRGFAKGSLDGGQLSGEVKNENKRRTFTFQGEFDEEMTYKATHAEISERGEVSTGTMVLR